MLCDIETGQFLSQCTMWPLLRFAWVISIKKLCPTFSRIKNLTHLGQSGGQCVSNPSVPLVFLKKFVNTEIQIILHRGNQRFWRICQMLVTVWSLWSMWSMGPGGFVWSMWLMILATIWSIDYTSVFAFGLKLSILKIFLHDFVFCCCACSVNCVEKINWGPTLLQQRVKVLTFDFQISTTIENNQRASSDAITTKQKSKTKRFDRIW